MQRLNGILETLTQPRKRREYDESLSVTRAVVMPAVATRRVGGFRPGPFLRRSPGRTPSSSDLVVSRGVEWLQRATRYWFWVLVGMTCAATAAVWWAMPPARSVTEVLPSRSARAFMQAPQRTHDAVEVRSEGFKVSVDPESKESTFAGNWLYTPQAGEREDLDGYPAVYVEFLLSEENGELVGNYRAKYKVPEKAISPEVLLRVRGRTPLGKSMRAAWSSRNGAKGVLQMTLRSPGLMSVAWWTTKYGRQLQLTSGSAILVRRQAP